MGKINFSGLSNQIGLFNVNSGEKVRVRVSFRVRVKVHVKPNFFFSLNEISVLFEVFVQKFFCLLKSLIFCALSRYGGSAAILAHGRVWREMVLAGGVASNGEQEGLHFTRFHLFGRVVVDIV